MYAVCKLSQIPIRSESKDSSEMISQLLFGECVELLEKEDNWIKIRCIYDSYEGWIDEKQVLPTDGIIEANHLSFQLSHSCTFEGNHYPICLGASLPNFDGLNFKIDKKKYVFNGQTLEISKSHTSRIRKIALQYLNAPYLWGGRSPFGIDCSGYTQMVFKFLGIKLPRDAYQQVELGATLNFASEAKLGDLAYFGDEERITHVGIVLENQTIIHASGQVRIDTIDHVGIYNAAAKKYTHKLKTIKRLFD